MEQAPITVSSRSRGTDTADLNTHIADLTLVSSFYLGKEIHANLIGGDPRRIRQEYYR